MVVVCVDQGVVFDGLVCVDGRDWMGKKGE